MNRQSPVETFYAGAKCYCRLIESLDEGRPRERYSQLLCALSSLAGVAVSLPHEEHPSAEQYADLRMNGELWSQLLDDMARIMEPQIIRLVGRDEKQGSTVNAVRLKGLAELYQVDAERLKGLPNDLAELYEDVHHGLRIYEIGSDDAAVQAAKCWQWRYRSHWGSHLYDALYSTYRIRYELLEGP